MLNFQLDLGVAHWWISFLFICTFSLFLHFFCTYFASLHDPLLAARLVELGLALSSTLDCTSVDQFYLYLHFFCTLYFMISFLVKDFLNLDMLSAWPWIAQIGGSVFSWFATQWIIRAPINHIRPCTWMQLIQMEISAALFQSRTETYLLDCLRQGKSLEKKQSFPASIYIYKELKEHFIVILSGAEINPIFNETKFQKCHCLEKQSWLIQAQILSKESKIF